MTKEKFKVLEGVFDEPTLNTLEVLKRKKYFDRLGRALKTGKEGDVYFAHKLNQEGVDEKRAVKMFRINSANFNKISQYITRDYRFKTIKGNKRKVIMMWAQKEFRNLNLCHKAQMNVPYPYIQMNNCIIMEYIDGLMLKDTPLENPQDFFEQLLEQIHLMRHQAKLVHGDLSEFNILVKNQIPYIIDLGQSMGIKNEDDFKTYYDLYERDVRNVINYFKKRYSLEINEEEIFEFLESK